MIRTSDKESIEIMTVGEFDAMTNNPRQRDTIRHAKMAQKHHLKAPSEIHKYVSAAVLPTGERIKLDGHTRAYLWKSGKLKQPDYVVVTLRSAPDMSEVMRMYLEYDNAKSAETNADKVSGALNQTNTQFQSSLLRSGKFISALCLAFSGAIDSRATEGEGLYFLLEYFRDDLLVIDEINPNPERFVSGVLAAAIITLRRHGPSALTFWDRYNRDMGEKFEREKDSVQMLTELIQQRRLQKSLASRHNVIDVCGRSVAACERWLKGEKYSGGIKCVDLRAYLKQTKTQRPSTK